MNEVYPLVFIHGWGNDCRIWQQLLPLLAPHRPLITVSLPEDDQEMAIFTAELAQELPDKFSLLGWSLGGQVATLLAEICGSRVESLMTLASNPKFVADDSWPCAMPQQTFVDFRSAYQDKPKQTLKRFAGLQAKGDVSERALVKTLIEQQPEHDNDHLLQWLEELDMRGAYGHIQCPVWHGFAANDALVPVAVAEQLQLLHPSHKVVIFPEASHALVWTHVEEIAEQIVKFLSDSEFYIAKQAVAKSFNAAASSYDDSAFLQRTVADNLLLKLPQLAASTVLDLGCGTGYELPALRESYPYAELIALDIAEGMLDVCRERLLADRYISADAESLPMANDSVDIIFTSLAIQWCYTPEKLFSEIARVLKPGGQCIFATLGPESLHELRDAWQQVDADIHVNKFVARGELDAAITSAGLQHVASGSYVEKECFAEPIELFRQLKNIGAHNINAGRPQGLTGRGRLKALCAAYEFHRQADGCLPASWDVQWGVLTV